MDSRRDTCRIKSSRTSSSDKIRLYQKQENLKAKTVSGLLVDMFDEDDEIPCANCFI